MPSFQQAEFVCDHIQHLHRLAGLRRLVYSLLPSPQVGPGARAERT